MQYHFYCQFTNVPARFGALFLNRPLHLLHYLDRMQYIQCVLKVVLAFCHVPGEQNLYNTADLSAVATHHLF